MGPKEEGAHVRAHFVRTLLYCRQGDGIDSKNSPWIPRILNIVI